MGFPLQNDDNVSRLSIDLQIQSYGRWFSDYASRNFKAYIVSFMFRPIWGNRATQTNAMRREIERFYACALTRIIRCPGRVPACDQPLLVVLPDFPVWKHDKTGLHDFFVNDGLHYHGIMCVPGVSRLRQGFAKHLRVHPEVYVAGHLQRVHARRIASRDLTRVTDYAFKSLPRRRASFDDLLVFPRTASEVRERQRNPW